MTQVAEQNSNGEVVTLDLSEVTAVKPKNPLDVLSEAQRFALNGRFNNSWTKPRQKEIAKMQESTGFSFYDACMAVSFVEDADGLIKSKRIALVADTMLGQAWDVLKGNKDVKASAFRSIETAYESLDVFEAPTAGKRFIDLLFKSKIILKKDAIRIQDLILEHLDIQESEWR